MGGTNLSDQSIRNGGTVDTWLEDTNGNNQLVYSTTANIPSSVAGYAVGCLLVATDTGLLYSNTGTISSCTFTPTPFTFTGNKGYYQVATNTTSTETFANVFGSSGAPRALTITAVDSIALDAAAANVSVLNGLSTVCTIAKGTSQGGVVGGTGTGPTGVLANTAVTSGTVIRVISDGSGNSTVRITFTVP